ncbi:hypothetical protein [Nostoc sp. NMS9]|uniref:hypothetical protein n=1 Tax=Nostoc sp. NMS9 TaxID=2815393 RepID=UPI0025D209F9|nr:hypothetical protein [Nostoc sp. NMS9]MBN3939310.1 hypothetical protein [Nostoc sp. NMS9]
MKNKIKAKTFNIENLQAPVIEELSDVEIIAIVGGESAGILESEIRELKTLPRELESPKEPQVIKRLELRLAGVERQAEETLKRIG